MWCSLRGLCYDVTTEELLGEVFSVQSVPRLQTRSWLCQQLEISQFCLGAAAERCQSARTGAVEHRS
jgi:hypothetical protein